MADFTTSATDPILPTSTVSLDEQGRIRHVMEQAAEIHRLSPSSIELTRNAKGDYQWVAKIYAENDDLLAVVRQLKVIDQALRDEFLPVAA